MDTQNISNFDEFLKNSYKAVEPADSWEQLRSRIDNRLEGNDLVSVSNASMQRRVVLWRRSAIGMAACFLITAGMFVYFLGTDWGFDESERKQISAANNLLDQSELARLNFAFSQVRQLFGKQTPWIMIGSGDSTQMGVADNVVSGDDDRRIIVVRLAVKANDDRSDLQYFDLVTYSDQQANFQLPLAFASDIDITLKPILRKDGTIDMQINGRSNGSSMANTIRTIGGDEFTSLLRMRANGNWINIDGVCRSISSI